MNGNPALFRTAWREAWRHRRRSALVIALVAFPVAVSSGVLTAASTIPDYPAEKRTREWGAADLMTHADLAEGPGNIEEALSTQVPAGSRVVPMTEGWEYQIIADDRAPERVQALLTDPEDPIHDGRFRVDSGHHPRDQSEVTVAPSLAEELDIGVGDELELYPGRERVEVVGLVSEQAHLQDPLLILHPDVAEATSWWVDLPAGSDQAAVASGLQVPAYVSTVDSRLEPPRGVADAAAGISLAYLGGVFVFMWTGVVASAAFSIGARRQLREIGLLAANGATRRQVRRLLLANAAVLGLVGSVIGAVVGVVVSGIVIGQMDDMAAIDHETGQLRVPLLAVGGTVVLGVACSVVAGLRPAARAARIPTTAALQGRMPRQPHHVRSVASGLVLGVLGVILIGQGASGDQEWPIAAGTGLVVLAAALLNRLFLAVVASIASRAGLSLRFAARDANRNPQRAGPAVVAAMVALAGTAGAITLTASYAKADSGNMEYTGRDDQMHLSISGVSLSEPVTRSISKVLPSADVEVSASWDEVFSGEEQSVQLVSGFLYADIDLHEPVDDVDIQRLRAAILEQVTAMPGGDGASVDIQKPGSGEYAGLTIAAIAGGSAVSLVVLGLVAALSRSETLHEMQTLHALGISPRRRWRLAGAAAGLLAIVAGLLAIPAGVVPMVAFLQSRYDVSMGRTHPIVIPWALIFAVVAGVALVLTAAGWLTARVSHSCSRRVGVGRAQAW